MIREYGSWHRSRWMDRGTGRENKQHLFPNETEKVSTLPDLDQGHGAQQVSGGGVVVIVQFFFVCLCVFFRPRKAGDKTMAVGGSRGRVPGSQTHTHTSKHFISITNHSVRNMNGLMHKIRSVRGCYSETF